MSELLHECGVAAIYHLPGPCSPLCPSADPDQASRLIPRMLLDIQNRGQLSAGITAYDPDRDLLIETYKDIGSVTEVFRMSHRGKCESLLNRYSGRAAIGHVRYATCGKEDLGYAQPFERRHLQKSKWFSFGFNGQLANYAQLRDRLLNDFDHHLTRETDTEIIMHEISRELSREPRPPMIDVMRTISRRFDGAYSLVLLNALGDMMIARDPLGIKPLCFAKEGAMFAAASESVALLNLGFQPENIHSLAPGHAITIVDGVFSIDSFIDASLFNHHRRAHCFFEWIYFANVASTLDSRSVYLTRTRLGVELARLEKQDGRIPIDDDTIVVPVPDTSKAAADAMAFELGIPSREGLIRNRYSGRTFIEGGEERKQKAQTKYTPLREVLEGKRIFLVEDSIVRSTTMRALLDRMRLLGKPKEIHVRVACPPIVAPCFYGIDMSTIDELFAPKFLGDDQITDQSPNLLAQDQMAESLGAESLRYLPVESIARAVGFPPHQLCQACITGKYPTPTGQDLYQLAVSDSEQNDDPAIESEPLDSRPRTYERERATVARVSPS